MAYVIGLLLALGVGVFGLLAGLDRDRAFYPVMAIIVSSYYVLFAAMGGSVETISVEATVMAAFVAMALAGFRFNLWLAAAALAAHGLFDAVHGQVIANAGVPAWWPAFCLSFDIGAALYLAWLLQRVHPARA
jgi:hypothetical protein